LVEAGLNELNNSALKPEVKPVINEFQDIPRDIDDIEFAEAEANEPWIQESIFSLYQKFGIFRVKKFGKKNFFDVKKNFGIQKFWG